MKVTKKAKVVDVKFIEVPTTRTEAHYSCPTCHCGFEDLNGWAMVEITRFRCHHCGQELIVKSRRTK